MCLVALARCAPRSPRFNPACMMSEAQECDLSSAPVCGIDETGRVKTFENKCMALAESCRRGTLYVEMKPGEC